MMSVQPATEKPLLKRWLNGRQLDVNSGIFVFDCDQTLIHGDIGEATLRLALQRRWIHSHDAWWKHLDDAQIGSKQQRLQWRACYERDARERHNGAEWPVTDLEGDELAMSLWHAYEQLCEVDVSSAYLFAARFAYQRSPVEIALLTLEAFERDPLVHPRPKIKSFIQELTTNGASIWIVSSSQIDVVRVIAAQYGIPAKQVIGIDFLRDPHTLCATDQLLHPAPIAALKIDALRVHTEQAVAMMAGDSRHDIPLMRLSKRGIFIDHGRDCTALELASEKQALVICASEL